LRVISFTSDTAEFDTLLSAGGISYGYLPFNDAAQAARVTSDGYSVQARAVRRPPERRDQGATFMGMPAAAAPPMSTGPAEPVPVAFIARTSTKVMQDPAASMRRQVRESEAKLPPGFFISQYFWDIESGGLAIDQRGHGSAHEQFADIGIPRDGGLADLLAEAAAPSPRFAAVICEDIERSGRDTFYASSWESSSRWRVSRCSLPMSRST
jgi:hypothetical protein